MITKQIYMEGILIALVFLLTMSFRPSTTIEHNPTISQLTIRLLNSVFNKFILFYLQRVCKDYLVS